MTQKISKDELEKAAFLLQKGEVVAFPTETVYGLGASVFKEEGVKKIFSVKGRPSDNPLIVHISDLAQVEILARDIPPIFYHLAKRFFPGPLTLIVPKAPQISSLVTAGLDSVAIRMPSYEIANKLISLTGEPLVAPSANLSGKPSATSVEHVLEDFMGKIPAVVLGEPSSIGIESTVVSLLSSSPVILRPGATSQEELEEYLKQKVDIYKPKAKEKVLSPGMKYRHYAPEAKVIIYSTQQEVEKHCLKDPLLRRMILSNTPSEGSIRYPLTVDSFYGRLRLADQLALEEVVLLCDEAIQKNSGFMNRIQKSSGL